MKPVILSKRIVPRMTVQPFGTSTARLVISSFHAVVKSRKKLFQEEDELHPGVFILVLDSTSASSGTRTIVKTGQVLRQFYDATTFYYHNKVGLNSRPNAFAMFSGARISELDERHFPGKSKSEYPNSCKKGLKRNETVTYDFVDQNYASIIAEDWVGTFNWPNCKGYGEPPTDHHGGAMILRTTSNRIPKDKEIFNNHFYMGECQEPYHKVMDYAGKFLHEYHGISKFAMIWLTLTSHDSASGLYRTDAMALPKYLRSNKQLILNLKQNSRRHTSQFDFYATLYDIARYARKDNFQKWDEHDFREEFGAVRGGIRAKSMLRPILYDRTCEEMEIPDEYCICERIWHKVDIYGDDAMRAAQILIEDINNSLKQRNVSEICETL
ncbi:unnamed protein product, partial [Litomosoides sigmodontis]